MAHERWWCLGMPLVGVIMIPPHFIGGGLGGSIFFLANWPLFTDGLVQRCYKDDEIRKIIGENMMRVCRKAWLNG